MRGAPRRAMDVFRVKGPYGRVHDRNFECLLIRQTWKNAREPLGKHRLA